MKRKVRVTITKVHRQTFAVPVTFPQASCYVCGREVEALSKTEASEILEVDVQALETLIIVGRVHPIETASGSVRLCKDSLFATR